MSNKLRKIKRNNLKKKIGHNKIKNFFHSEYDSLEQKIRKIKNEKR